MTAFSHVDQMGFRNISDKKAYKDAVKATLYTLKDAVSTQDLTLYSNRPTEEVEALQKEVANVVPAGNIVALVTSSLAGLRGRKLPDNQAQSDVSALLRGIEVLPRTVFGTFFVPTAAILSAYQTLLTLTGKDQESAFPNGLWQFYLEFAMREDSANHANETIGFQTALTRYSLNLDSVNQLAAWVCAASQIYFQYDDIILNDWREQVYLNLFEEVVNEVGLGEKLQFQRLQKSWATQKPYQRGHDTSQDENYALYRRRRFDNFIESRLKFLPPEHQQTISDRYKTRMDEELHAYQEQMTILSTLNPERYREVRQPLSLWQTKVGVILNGSYYLIPACYTDQAGRPILFQDTTPNAPFYALRVDSHGRMYSQQGHVLGVARSGQVYDGKQQLHGYLRPAHYQTIRQQIAAIYQQAKNRPSTEMLTLPEFDQQLLQVGRTEQDRARSQLDKKDQLAALKTAPILINWDEQSADKPLAYIRKGKRGVNDNPLTIFHTDQSMIFDQSHIFFDGIDGLAISEILTGEAISWAVYFTNLSTPEPSAMPIQPLQLTHEPVLENFTQVSTIEISGESLTINLTNLNRLRKQLPKHHFKKKKPTVNDFLILYRCKFGFEYQFSEEIEAYLTELESTGSRQALEAVNLVRNITAKLQSNNPSILIPLSAAGVKPRDRLYPTTFRNPFGEIWGGHYKTVTMLDRYLAMPNPINWSKFADSRGAFLTQLSYFIDLLDAYKRVALQGGSTSTATMKLLAHLPNAFREILNEIPERIDVLNEVLKGEEVISNVGRVANGSSITRFISAKDDNENKTLVWGVVSDNNDNLCLSLRDFRPYIAAFAKIDRLDIAQLVVDHLVESFAVGFNTFINSLLDIMDVKKGAR
ncbi:hypothetical protein QUF64_14650 [Anaerolineales bacterium HSG6]|nr:hypothetical protein [Anaerolineales bacterium HSG6]